MSVDPLRNPEPLIRRVYAYVAYRIGDGPEAEDITSETFERALRYRDSYDPTKGEPAAWLIGIARYRIASAPPPTTPLTDDMSPADPGDLELDSTTRLTVAAAVASLEARDAELLALRYGADLTAKQIGEALGMKTNAVEVALHRALGRLRAVLGDSAMEA